jgi:hypothetical protein
VEWSSWERPASLAQVGGFRPPEHPRASWFGTVRLALPGELWPTTDGEPMLALAQINLGELPCPAPAILSDVAFLTLFVGARRLPIDEPNGTGWALRTYASLDELVPVADPTPEPARLRPFPIRWHEALDLPCRDDLPLDYLDAGGARPEPQPGSELTSPGTKVGGWPYYIQSSVEWRTGRGPVADGHYVLQVGTEEKAGWSWGHAGIGYIARQPGQGAERWHLTWQCY